MNQHNSWDPEQENFDEKMFFSEEERDECREILDRIELTLNTIELPSPPPGLVDEVMDYIEWRENRRLWFLQLPGISAVVESGKTLYRYMSRIQWPMMLQREYLPVTLTVFAILWSVFLTPRLEAGQMEPYITRANQVADTLLIKGETITNQVRLMAEEWIQKTQKVSPISNDEEKVKESSTKTRINFTDPIMSRKTT